MIPYEVALRHLGPPAPTPPHMPGPLAFSDRDYVRSILERAGFADIVIDRETPGIIGSSPGGGRRNTPAPWGLPLD